MIRCIKLNGDKALIKGILDYLQFSSLCYLRRILDGKLKIPHGKGTTAISSKNFHVYKEELV